MHQSPLWPQSKSDLYPMLAKQLVALCRDTPPVSALANAAALLWEALPDINWAGFYLLKENVLWLGPFQGKPACTMIPVGRGVCGTAAATRALQLVPDVDLFPGHIACDSASRSEIVIPLVVEDGTLLGVLDIDSPIRGRFTPEDAEGLQHAANELLWCIGLSHGLL